MKKATTIIFGLMGLIFGLVFTSTKIYAYKNSLPTYIYWAEYYDDTIGILAPELPNTDGGGMIDFFDFIEQWSYYYTDNAKNALITIDSVKIDYNDTTNNKKFIGYIDQINIYVGQDISDYIDITFYYQGNLIYSYDVNNYDVIQGTLTVTSSLLKETANAYYKLGYDKGYKVGYNKAIENMENYDYDTGYQDGLDDGFRAGFDKGYQDGISAVYYNGFGGFINPDTNKPYDETYSYPYGQGYDAGFNSTEAGGTWGVLFSALFAPFQVLGMELLPGVTIGMIVAVPLIFGLLAWILSAGKSKK